MSEVNNNTTSSTTYRPRPLAFVLAFVVLGLIILAAAVFVVTRWMAQVETRKPRPTQENIPFVTLQSVVLSDNQATFSTGGFVSAKTSANIAAEVSGTVLTLSPTFAVGNHVKQGDMLAVIDDKNYVASVAAATANLATAKSNYTQEQAKSRQAARDAKRLNIKATNLSLRKPQLAAAKAGITNAEAQLTLAKQNLAKTTVKAPFDAVIQARNISVGDNVGANSVVAQLIGTETFTVKLTLDSNQFNLVSIGDKATLTHVATGASYTATISRFDPTLNQTTRTVGAYVDIDQPLSGEKPLLLNSYLTAEVTGKTLADTLWISNSDSVENRFVWIKDDDNTLKKIPFTLLYRGAERSLVRFDTPIDAYITQPKDSFFIGETVTTEKRQRPKPRGQGKGTKQGKPEGGKRETE